MQVVSDGTRVFFGSSADDQVRCLDLATGELLWTFFAEGPVRLAPVVHQGRVYFGSGDGSAYCLAADDGSLIWTHRVAESERRIPGNGRIINRAEPIQGPDWYEVANLFGIGYKIIRGGSWYDRPKRAHSAYRLSYRSYHRVFNVGFRIVCE